MEGANKPLEYPRQYPEMIPGNFRIFQMGDENEEQNDPFGTLNEFLDKEKFDTRFSQAMEAQANEERITTGYTKEPPKETVKTNKRTCVFIIITETQAIQEKINSTSKRSNLANASAVFVHYNLVAKK